MKLVTAAEMREIDRTAIEQYQIPSLGLMEAAGLGIAAGMIEAVLEAPAGAKVAIFCGRGNNGGDGLVLGRILANAGVTVQIFVVGPLEKLSRDARVMFDKAVSSGVVPTELTSRANLPEYVEADIVVDALLGTGTSGAAQGFIAELIEYINQQAAEVISVDIPSGLDADTGECPGPVVQASHTFTLGLPKYGLYLSPGREMAGQVSIVEIGIPEEAVAQIHTSARLIRAEFVASLLPHRRPDGHKGEFGKLLIVAGSTGLTGAACLASEAAMRSGCGLVKLACPSAVQPVLASKVTEIMTVAMPDVARKGVLALRGLGGLRELMAQHDAVVLGPGIGRHHETQELICRVIAEMDRPVIVDADALFALRDNTADIARCRIPAVLTPHPKEFEALTGRVVPGHYDARIRLVAETARELKAVLILKGSPSIVADPLGNCWLNPTGNDGMAKGGSGDVLSGIIGSMLAQGMTPRDAALAGVYLHGLAGDLAAEFISRRAMIASDIVTHLSEAFLELEESLG